jgi:hypothetical protein
MLRHYKKESNHVWPTLVLNPRLVQEYARTTPWSSRVYLTVVASDTYGDDCSNKHINSTGHIPLVADSYSTCKRISYITRNPKVH